MPWPNSVYPTFYRKTFKKTKTIRQKDSGIIGSDCTLHTNSENVKENKEKNFVLLFKLIKPIFL